MKTKVYLSDPCTGIDDYVCDHHFAFFENFLNNAGIDCFNPRKNGLPRKALWHEHMRKDLAALTECTALLRLSHLTSKGVALEEHVARALSIPIITYEQFINCPTINDLKHLLTQ